MPTYRCNIIIGADTPNVADRFVITPHFRAAVDPPDFNALAQEVATAFAGFWNGVRETRAVFYRADQPKPNYPLGQHTANSGLYPGSSLPRELAVCLSFYSGQNIPRQRGRLYLPLPAISSASVAKNVSSALMTTVKSIGPMLADVGDSAFEWCVWSRRDSAPKIVTNYYVDDEWDVIRSRGQKSTQRQVGSTAG